MIPHYKLVLRDSDRAAVAHVMDSGWLNQGLEVESLEYELADRFRPNGRALCVSSGTAALYLAVKALYPSEPCPDIAPLEISIPTYACSALSNAVWMAGYKVRLMDISPADWSSGSAIYTHTYGIPADRAQPIEDFTHAPGAEINGKPCGSLGTLSVISFGATKPLGAGAGGAILGPKDLIEQIQDVRDYDGKPDLKPRFNFQMSDLSAAIVRSRLARLEIDNRWRAQTLGAYGSALRSKREYRSRCVLMGTPEQVRDWRGAFAWSGVETLVPIRPDELLHVKAGVKGYFPVAERIAESTLSIPMWPGMTDEQVSKVASLVRSL